MLGKGSTGIPVRGTYGPLISAVSVESGNYIIGCMFCIFWLIHTVAVKLIASFHSSLVFWRPAKLVCKLSIKWIIDSFVSLEIKYEATEAWGVPISLISVK